MNDILNQRAAEVLDWLAKFSPEVHTMVMERLTAQGAAEPPANGLEGLSQTTATATEAPKKAWWETALSTVGDVAGQYFAIDAQRQMTKVNVERAKQGQPPIPTEYTAPTIRHVVDMPVEYKEEARRLGVGMQNALIWGGVGVAALLLFLFMGQGRR